MSLVSLEKYLKAPRAQATAAPRSEELPVAAPPPGYLELCTRTVSAIRRCVFTGELFADLSQQMEALRSRLQVESEQTGVSESAIRVEGLLETFQQRTRDAARERANDFKEVLNILNETVSHLHSGSEKSGARLNQLETSLSRAAKIDDLNTLRSHLTKVLDYVRQEEKRDQDEAHKTLEALNHRVQEAHAVSSRFRVQLSSRAEAIEYLTAAMGKLETCPDLHAAVFVADSLRALRVRHGEEVGDGVLEELARKQIGSLTPSGKIFTWSPTSLLLTWQHTPDMPPPGSIPSQVKSPIEHRAFVGTRVATFNIVIRSLVLPAKGSVDELVTAFDRFYVGNRG